MNIIEVGHHYQLNNFEKPTRRQSLKFINKVPVKKGSIKLKTVYDGTTNEEVLAVLIDRMQYLNKKFPCHENSIVITHLETALLFLEKRTRDRIKRGVEGKQIA